MLKYQTLIPLKFSYLLTCCTFIQVKFNHKIPLFLSSPSLLLVLLFPGRFSNVNRSVFSSSTILCRLPRWEAPDSDLSSPHMLINNCLTSLLFLLQQWILRAACSAVQTIEYLSHCTTEFWKTICQGEVWLKCLWKTVYRHEDNQSDSAIPDHTLRIKKKKKKIIAKDREKGLEKSNSF